MAGGWPLGLEICNGADQGTDTSNSRGTAVTCATNAYGNYVQLVASSATDASMVLVQVQVDANINGGNALAVKLAVGAAASEKDIILDLICVGDDGTFQSAAFLLPVSIPAGTRISAASSGSSSGDTAYVSVVLFDAAFTQMEGCSGVDSIGFSSPNSGTSLTPGAGNTKGGYAQLVASSAKDYLGFIVSFDMLAANQGTHHWLIDVAIGAGGSEKIIVPNLFAQSLNAGAGVPGVTGNTQLGPFWIPIPAGTRIAARGQNEAGSSHIGVMLYGIYQ